MSRAGTFVFMIDNRFFGTLTAYVIGSESAQYHFTSALPVQVLKLLAPVLQPLMHAPPVAETDTVPPRRFGEKPATVATSDNDDWRRQ